MNIPEDLKFADTHEWVRVDLNGIATVGISDHAQAELTDIVFAEPPKVGSVFAVGAVAAVVESVKAASDIYAPVGGEVIEANAAIADNPGLINSDPHGEGWIFKIRLSNPADLDALMDASAYAAHISQ